MVVACLAGQGLLQRVCHALTVGPVNLLSGAGLTKACSHSQLLQTRAWVFWSGACSSGRCIRLIAISPRRLVACDSPQPHTRVPQEAAGQAGVQRVEQRSLAAAVGSLLGGVRTVTMSAPGVLLHQWTPAELQARARLRMPPLRARAGRGVCHPGLGVCQGRPHVACRIHAGHAGEFAIAGG